MKNDNIFAKIVNREIKSYIVYEDSLFMAVLDLFPKQNGHLLLLPKTFKNNILLEEDLVIEKMFVLAKKLSQKIKEELNASAIKWVLNSGKESGQEILYTHLHIIPYYSKKSKNYSLSELEKIFQDKFGYKNKKISKFN